ncbi:metallophosphoesterase [Sporosarcina limicola]|uniref:MPP superfamily phosphohydrolase n=1 Tax=Sporosarcina limicola TaxID=34101 RepID=A0A927MJ43_9BACL|nr:metallophosphoesterase [Sporosarcina limicola]MBE1554092.1 putative MPP superfamily phosphohydrolase [Sporosarcina limicola]
MISLKKTLWLLALFLIGMLTFMFVSARGKHIIYHKMNVVNTDSPIKELSVFFISDIHRRKIDEKLVMKVKAGHEIDMVIIGGDLAEKGVPRSRIEKNIRNLARLGPVFYVWGNNDREVGEEVIREIITRHGGKILDNESAGVPSHPQWGICGTDDPSSRNVDIDSTLRYITKYEHVILITHTPSLFRKVEPYYQPRLMLAGHTHGGQIRIGKYGLTDKGAFRMEDGRAKLVSNGYGTSTVPLRLGAAPECHVITINYA